MNGENNNNSNDVEKEGTTTNNNNNSIEQITNTTTLPPTIIIDDDENYSDYEYDEDDDSTTIISVTTPPVVLHNNNGADNKQEIEKIVIPTTTTTNNNTTNNNSTNIPTNVNITASTKIVVVESQSGAAAAASNRNGGDTTTISPVRGVDIKQNSSHPNLTSLGKDGNRIHFADNVVQQHQHHHSQPQSSSLSSQQQQPNSQTHLHHHGHSLSVGGGVDMPRSQSHQNMTSMSQSTGHAFHHSHKSSLLYGFARDDVSVSFHDTYNDNQRIHLHPNIGLSSQQASEKLVGLVENLLEERELLSQFSRKSIMIKELGRVTPMLYVLGALLLVVAFALEVKKFQAIHLIIEAGLMLLYVVLHTYMHVREERLEHNEIIAKARGHIKKYMVSGDVLEEGVTTNSESISVMSCCRDDRWRKVPLNLLVEGDHVSLREGEQVQIMLECIEPHFEGVVLLAGDLYTTDVLEARLQQINPDMTDREDVRLTKAKLFTSGRCCFRVHETPCFSQLNVALRGSASRPSNPVMNAINYIRVISERFLWLSVAISLVANIIRAALQKDRSLVDLLIIRQVDLLIAFSMIMLPCILLLIAYSIGHAKLLAMFDILQEQSLQGEIADDHPALNFDTVLSTGLIPKVPFKLMKNYWEAILSSKHVAFSHSSGLLHHIASTTVLCCIDKEGIVSEPVSTVGEICYYREGEPVRLELSSEYSHTQYSITFNDSDWKEHLNALKPLGLDCLLNKTCRLYSASQQTTPRASLTQSTQIHADQASKLQLIRDREDTSGDSSNAQCLCLLAKEIGFSDDVANRYVRLKEIHTLTQRSVRAPDQVLATDNAALIEASDQNPSMISLVAKDANSETLQLLSKGSTDLILDHCNHYWDGESIVIFSEEDKEKLRQIFHKLVVNDGMRCISFAYKPIEQKFRKMFVSGSVNSPLVDVRFSNSVVAKRNAATNSNEQDLRIQVSKKGHQRNESLNNPSIVVLSPITDRANPSQTIALSPKQLEDGLIRNNQKQQQPLISNSPNLSSNTPKPDVVIFVESPIPSGKQSPNLPNNNSNNNNNNSDSTTLVVEEKIKRNRTRQTSVSSQISTITKHLNLPPVSLVEYDSSDERRNGDIGTSFEQTGDDDDEDQEDMSQEEDQSDTSSTYSDDSTDEADYYDDGEDDDCECGDDSSDSATMPVRNIIIDSSSYTESSESDSKIRRRNRKIKSKSKSKSSSKSRTKSSKSKKKEKKKGGDKKKKIVVFDDEDNSSSSTPITTQDLETPPQTIKVEDSDSLTVEPSHLSWPETSTIAENDTLEQLQNDQIFIGMAGIKILPKSHANHFVEVLRAAGVRFVYFSNDERRISNSFVNKLGLETDWNCCVSLRDPGPNEPDLQDGPSRLPKGISAIRSHLDEVDNVPLLVPMFSNSTSETKLEMIKILQENGEVVCCLGSALKYENTPIFAQSDLAFSLEPAVSRCLNMPLNKSDPRPLLTSRNFFDTKEFETFSSTHLPGMKMTDTKRVPTENPSTKSLSADITSLPCSLVFHRRTDFNEIVELFHVGRQQLTNTRQCLQFILSASMWLVLMCLVAGILVVSMPTDGVVGGVPLTGLQVMWLTFIIIPMIGYSLLATSGDQDVMMMLSPKNNESFKHMPTFARYIAIRLVPSILLTVFFFIWSLHDLSGASWSNIIGASLDEWPADHEISYSDALLISQNIMMFAFVYYLAFTSISFIHHTQSIFKNNPLRRNNVWIILVFLSISFQVAFSFISLKAIDGIHLLSQVSWYLYVVLFCWAFGVVVLDEFVKHLYKKWFDDFQLELRLEFDTRLGQFSPI